ncbi:MAG: hypothetical protein MK108_05200 [Mariniblastus sp.]|nr:hypothetical protein [Mariniblastus sp.]
MSSRRKGRRNDKPNRSHQNRRGRCDYQQLEARQLLAIDVGLNFTSATLGTETTSLTPNVSADMTNDHIVQMMEGNVSVFDKAGNVLQSVSLDQFWTDMGATVDTALSNPRVVFDHGASKWFTVALDEGGAFTNEIFIGWSDSADPTGSWQSLQFVADSDGLNKVANLTMGVDASGLVLAAEMGSGSPTSAVYGVPKGDLFHPEPNLFNMVRYETLNPAVYGSCIHYANDVNDNTSGDAVGLGVFNSGTTIVRTDVVDLNGVSPGLSAPTEITVPFYEAAPDARQPSGEAIDNVSPFFTSNVQLVDGYLWAVHTVTGAGGGSAIRWYQIDAATNQIENQGEIANPDFDFLAPSIDVGPMGIAAIGFTATGPSLRPGAYVAMGHTSFGLDGEPEVVFDSPSQLLQQGLGDYHRDDAEGVNRWSSYGSTHLDPSDPFNAWTFVEYANTDNNWSIKVAESKLFALNPTVRGDNGDNTIVIRRNATNTDWIDVEFDGVTTDTFEMNSLNILNIDAMGGDDTIILDMSNGLVTSDDGLTLRGGPGYDVLQVIDSEGHEFRVVDGHRGRVDELHRFLEVEELVGTDAADSFYVDYTTLNTVIRGMGGNDYFWVDESIRALVDLHGGTGDDVYRLSLRALTSGLLRIHDSVGSEYDQMFAEGTEGDDVLLMRYNDLTFNNQKIEFVYPGIEELSLDGAGGDDVFSIQANDKVLHLYGSYGNDSFNISNDAPDNLGNTNLIEGELFIDGGAGQNRLFVSNRGGGGRHVTITDNQITGIAPATIHYTAEEGGFSVLDDLAGIEVHGSDSLADVFDVRGVLASNTLRVEGGGGRDVFTVRQATQGSVVVDGGTGGDIYRVAVGNGDQRFVFVDDSGLCACTDRILLSGTSSNDDMTIDDEKIVLASEQVIFNEMVEVVTVNMYGGDDSLTLKNNQMRYLRVILGDGDDSIVVDEARGVDSIRMDGNEGDDLFVMQNSVVHSFIAAWGHEGDDRFYVSDFAYARMLIDGGEDSDLVDIDFSGRNVRDIDARDSGTSGTDELRVFGSSLIDRVDVYPTYVSRKTENVVYNQNQEKVVVDTGDNDDIVKLYGSLSQDLTVNTRSGFDLMFVHRTIGAGNVVLDAGIGNDVVNVYATTPDSDVTVYGQGGDDNFNVGSTLASDNGNFAKLQGALNLVGGPGSDRVYANDRGVTAAYDYYMDGQQITNLNAPGSYARPSFAGINYSSVEFSRLDGTDQQNHFSVMPSTSVRMHVDGNLPEASELADPQRDGDFLDVLGDPLQDGRQLYMTGPGQGVWKFAIGFQDVAFENIEAMQDSDEIPMFGGGNQGDQGDDDGGDGPSFIMVNGRDLTLSGSVDSLLNGLDTDLRDADFDADDDERASLLSELSLS